MAVGSLNSAWVFEVQASDSRLPRQFAAGIAGVDLLTTYTPSATGWVPGCGVVDLSDFLVKQNGTPNMSILVEGGYAFVRGAFSPYNQGIYGIPADNTDVNVSVPASDPTNSTNHFVVLQVRDDTWGGSGGFNDIRLLVHSGTPGAGDPVLTSLGTCMVLARIVVPALASTVTNAMITDLRKPFAAAGGILRASSARRTALTFPAGVNVYWHESDTGRLFWWEGTTWRGKQTEAFSAAGAGGSGIVGDTTITALVVPAQGCAGTVWAQATLFVSGTVAGDQFQISIYQDYPAAEGGSDIVVIPTGGAATGTPCALFNHSNAAHTYAVILRRAGGSGSASTFADGRSNRLQLMFVPD